jgi:hypothetical protein
MHEAGRDERCRTDARCFSERFSARRRSTGASIRKHEWLGCAGVVLQSRIQ